MAPDPSPRAIGTERGCVEDQPQRVGSSKRREFAACCGWSRTTQPRSVPTALRLNGRKGKRCRTESGPRQSSIGARQLDHLSARAFDANGRHSVAVALQNHDGFGARAGSGVRVRSAGRWQRREGRAGLGLRHDLQADGSAGDSGSWRRNRVEGHKRICCGKWLSHALLFLAERSLSITVMRRFDSSSGLASGIGTVSP